MDPNATVDEMLTLANDGFIRDGLTSDEADRFINLFNALDEWLCRGGFIPDRWAQVPVNAIPLPVTKVLHVSDEPRRVGGIGKHSFSVYSYLEFEEAPDKCSSPGCGKPFGDEVHHWEDDGCLRLHRDKYHQGENAMPDDPNTGDVFGTPAPWQGARRQEETQTMPELRDLVPTIVDLTNAGKLKWVRRGGEWFTDLDDTYKLRADDPQRDGPFVALMRGIITVETVSGDFARDVLAAISGGHKHDHVANVSDLLNKLKGQEQ
jgi:hypothetical protein